MVASTSTSAAEQRIAERIKQAGAAGQSLQIVGHRSKRFYGRQLDTETLSTESLTGILGYDPSELVVTVAAGTPLLELEAMLADHGQYLPCEPPILEGKGTVGGMVASAMAGPGRPWLGAVRDFVLGLKLINGRGELLRFGGQVMKNVAGYDVSRLMVGAMGCLGLITEVSLKVLPLPACTRFFWLAISRSELLARSRQWRTQMTPISGISYQQDRAFIRLQGSASAVTEFAQAQHLLEDSSGAQYWYQLRHLEGDFFKGDEALWRISQPRETDLDDVLCPYVLDWSGAQYWLKTDRYDDVLAACAATGGHAYAYHARADHALPALSNAHLQLHQRLKAAYDPAATLNVGRMYADF